MKCVVTNVLREYIVCVSLDKDFLSKYPGKTITISTEKWKDGLPHPGDHVMLNDIRECAKGWYAEYGKLVRP